MIYGDDILIIGSQKILKKKNGEKKNLLKDFFGLSEKMTQSHPLIISGKVDNIIKNVETPYSHISNKENEEILTKIIKGLNLNADHNINKIIDHVIVGNFENLKLSLDLFFDNIRNTPSSSFEKIFEKLNKLSYFVKIINSILILSLKIDVRIERKIQFIEYFIEKLEESDFAKKIAEIPENLKKIENKEEQKEKIKIFNEIMIKFFTETSKFKRNFAYTIDHSKPNIKNKMSSLSEKAIQTIINTNSYIKKYIGDNKEKQKNITIEKILIAITTINKCAYKIISGNGISETESEEAICSLNLLYLYQDKIDLGNIKGAIVISELKNMFRERDLKNKNKALKQITLYDHLTQLGNRKNLDDTLVKLVSNLYRRKNEDEKNEEIEEILKGKKVEKVNFFKKYGNYFLMFDIDFFKKVNDKYGHDIGDKVLIHFANILKTNIRIGDDSYRYGGEEFAVITGEISQEQACKFGEKLRKIVEATPYTNSKKGIIIKLTVSIGICSINAFINNDNQRNAINEILVKADQALYKAKKSGRNQCIIVINNDLKPAEQIIESN